MATHTHGPYQLSPQAHWQQTYHSHRGGSGCRRCPQPLIPQRQRRQQQQRQPPPLPPSPLRQRLGPVRGAQKGSPAIAAARMEPASAPKPVTSTPTAVSATASSGPALPSAAGALLEPSEPTEARPLPAPAACGSFTSYGAGAQLRPSFWGCVLICLASAWAFRSLAGTLGLSSLHTHSGPCQESAHPNSWVSASTIGVPDFRARPVFGASAPAPWLVPCLCYLSS